MIRFNYNLYGERACGILARSWYHTLQWLFNLELESPLGEGRPFTAADHAAYPETTEFRRLVLEDHRPCIDAAPAKIRGLLTDT